MSKKPKPICSTTDCGKISVHAGLCTYCYGQALRARKAANNEICKQDGCDKIGWNSGLCQPHYKARYRERRLERIAKGELIPVLVPTSLQKSNGYLVGYVPDHPLSNKSLQLYEHRRVAYEKYGPGEHNCHWCDTTVDWKAIEVDHLDWVRDNNDPDNLVVSCKPCNQNRTERNSELPVQEAAASEAKAKMRALAKRLGR
ncbi:HNH endonuclease [Sphingobium yanoikuyae]|uniref:HNH endonuclease n=1 Tax=Sphingobium yanoikuyae TaxID=13690 RepID=UPI0012DACB8F|nr:HNH endonuclease signature motif containing protein [Sphingobium yanoikuyae]